MLVISLLRSSIRLENDIANIESMIRRHIILIIGQKCTSNRMVQCWPSDISDVACDRKSACMICNSSVPTLVE